jgi:hypothetical protein
VTARPTRLSDDISRCPGYQIDGHWREGCADCLRRTAPAFNWDRVRYMEPPPIIVFECEMRIEP